MAQESLRRFFVSRPREESTHHGNDFYQPHVRKPRTTAPDVHDGSGSQSAYSEMPPVNATPRTPSRSHQGQATRYAHLLRKPKRDQLDARLRTRPGEADQRPQTPP